MSTSRKPPEPRRGRPRLPPSQKLEMVATTLPPAIRRIGATLAREYGVTEAEVWRTAIDLRKAEKILSKRREPTSGIEPLTYGLRNPEPAFAA